MKKFVFLAVCALFAASALFAAPPKIVVRNSTGSAIHEVYVSPSSSGDWGEDYLAGAVLAGGDDIAITLPLPLSKQRVYDIMLIDAEGDSYSRMEETVSENGVITITFEDYDEEPAYYEDDED